MDPDPQNSAYTIRAARPGEGAVVQQILNHASTHDDVALLVNQVAAIPEEHGLRLFGVAEHEDGTICGAVSAGPMDAWIRNQDLPRVALQELTGNAIEMIALVVHPQDRGVGLGRRLIKWVQATATAAGYRLLLVRFDIERPDLAAYYSGAGFMLLDIGRPGASALSPVGP